MPMRIHSSVLAVIVGVVLAAASHQARGADLPDHLVGTPALEVASGPHARNHPTIEYHRAPPDRERAWKSFTGSVGGQWFASWDMATRVPSRIFGSGIQLAGSVGSADLAAVYARYYLEQHIDLLAPGTDPADFAIVSNHLDDTGMRSIGMAQTSGGMRVLGGQVGFRFKNDRLFVISSEAVPDVYARAPDQLISDADASASARTWLLSDRASTVRERTIAGPYVLPIIAGDGVVDVRTVLEVTFDSDPIGRWSVYVDAETGVVVARRQTLMFAEGTVLYRAPERYPDAGRINYPAKFVQTTVDGTISVSDSQGLVTWTGDVAGALNTRVTGDFVRVINFDGTEATGMFSLEPDGAATWSVPSDDTIESQITTYVHAQIAKDYARTFAPLLGYLNDQLQATVNIDMECNAFSDGETINFFKKSEDCENTGRLADVIYHEFGHAIHRQSVIDGVGRFDFASSEGLSDYFAATITNDPHMGVGFFYDDNPLRDLNPDGKEHRWPDDIGEVHYTGRIIAGALWDLRTILSSQFGQATGVALTDKLFYAIVQRSSDIPSTYIEALAADDDDGDLTNGTPNGCSISSAFGPHGLRALTTVIDDPGAAVSNPDGFEIGASVVGLIPDCPGDQVFSASVEWKHEGDDSTSGSVSLELDDDDVWRGVIPDQPNGTTVLYQLHFEFFSGNERQFPENPADRYYQLYVGEVIELYCTDFESDPFADGWTHGRGGEPNSDSEWQWGPPLGTPGSGDPSVAFSGDNVLGVDLGSGDGDYEPNIVNFAQSPTIDVGDYSDVRLHYRRWLNVEDAFYDQASIYANGELAYRNLDSMMGEASSTHHRDSSWRFHGVPVSTHIRDGALTLRFEQATDGGLEFGGWTVDNVCVVAVAGSICGDGNLTGAEQCDEGASNDDVPDACRTNCRVATCGDTIVDTGEECDDGNADNDDDCTTVCSFPDTGGGGCCSTTRGGPDSWPLLVLVAIAVLRRRRRG
jgi:MYXO-CTERM domain-containing protein